jgi:hypothetical protein
MSVADVVPVNAYAFLATKETKNKVFIIFI